MSKISGIYALTLVVVSLALTLTASAANWPVNGFVDLSSGFGEYRPNRFHAGVDIRTRGKTGTPVWSPIDGSVWRVKMSYDGYGKGLYLKNANGHVYVFGHLEDFSAKIDSVVKASQVSSKRYYQDQYFPADSIPVAKNEFIGYTGRTGGTAPHLHFELRSPDNKPLNPLLHNFWLDDYEYPVFQGMVFQMTADRSLFANSARNLEFTVHRVPDSGIYRLDTVLYFNKPFGILTACYDLVMRRGMPITPYLLALFYDDSLHYQVVMDTLDFEHQRSVNFEYDLPRAARGHKRVRRLYHLPGNEYEGSRASAPGAGIFGQEGPVSIGLHHGKAVAMDHRGNITELFFDFVWGPDHDFFDLDSVVTSGGNRTLYYLSPGSETYLLPIDSVAVLENSGDTWERPPSSRITLLGKRDIVFETDNIEPFRSVMRLHLFSGGCTIPDKILTKESQGLMGDVTVNYEVADDGLLVTLDTDASGLASPVAQLYYGDSLLGEEELKFQSMHRYAAFIPPVSKYSRVDRITGRLSRDKASGTATVPVNIYIVGNGTNQMITAGDRFTVRIGQEHLYQPRFIELRTRDTQPEYLKVLPEAFACRADFELSINRPVKTNPTLPEGVCWWDDKDSNWVWLDNVYGNDGITSAVAGGGSFRILVDREKPVITDLSVTDGLTYFDPQQEISFVLTDTLSGFEDDRNILIELNDEWMIPEYNPSTRICKTKPLKPLSDGRHSLKIVATDRVGNRTEKNLQFFVKKQD